MQIVDWKKTGEYVEDVAELHAAIEAAKGETAKPSIIVLRTIIGWPSPGKQNTGKIHGSALGGDELAATKKVLGFDPEQSFVVADDVLAHTRSLQDRGAEARAAWQESFDAWAAANPERKALFDRLEAGELPAEVHRAALPVFEAGKDVSTRAASGTVINALAAELPELWGGSADLAESNLTTIKDAKSFIPAEWSTHEWSGDPYGRVLHFGIREHAMGAIVNGIVLHGPTRAFGGTFLIFSDYMRPSVRTRRADGHPVDLRVDARLRRARRGRADPPADRAARGAARHPELHRGAPRRRERDLGRRGSSSLRRHGGPAGIALTRQNIPVFARGEGEADPATSFASADSVAKGAYVLAEAPSGTPDVILIATGSEVQLAVAARETLAAEGINARVVSAPSLEWFDEQDDAYREKVLPAAVKARVSVEAGSASPGAASSATTAAPSSIEHFGASADYKTLFQKFGITADAVVEAARETIAAASAAEERGEGTHEHPHREARRRGRQHLARRPVA